MVKEIHPRVVDDCVLQLPQLLISEQVARLLITEQLFPWLITSQFRPLLMSAQLVPLFTFCSEPEPPNSSDIPSVETISTRLWGISIFFILIKDLKSYYCDSRSFLLKFFCTMAGYPCCGDSNIVISNVWSLQTEKDTSSIASCTCSLYHRTLWYLI